jgi:hypothetical protein
MTSFTFKCRDPLGISKGRTGSYLLADTSRLSAEDRIPSQQARKEAIVPAFLPGAGGVDVPENDHGRLVDHGECGEVPSVLARCLEDELDLFSESIRCIR